MEKWDADVDRIAAANIVFLVTVIVFQVIGFLPLDFLKGSMVGRLIVSQTLVMLPGAYFLIKSGKPYCEAVQLKKLRISDILLCLLFCFMISPLLNFVNAVSMVFFKNSTTTTVLDLAEQVPWYIGFFIMALLPAIVEETLFRGVFYQEYRKADPLKAVILSGFMFGLLHGNFNQFCYAFLIGMIFALMLEATGSILSTMVLHFCVNAGATLTVYLYPVLHSLLKMSYYFAKNEGTGLELAAMEELLGDVNMTTSEWLRYLMETTDTSRGLSETIATYAPSAIFWSVLAFFLFRHIARRNGNWEKICELFKRPTKENRSLLTVPLVAAIAIGVVAMFFYELMMRMPQAV